MFGSNFGVVELCSTPQRKSANNLFRAQIAPTPLVPHRFVKNLIGKTVKIECSPNTAVQDLKSTITKHRCFVKSHENAIPPEGQRLIFAGRQLEDSKTLGYYGVLSGATIHLVLRLRGEVTSDRDTA